MGALWRGRFLLTRTSRQLRGFSAAVALTLSQEATAALERLLLAGHVVSRDQAGLGLTVVGSHSGVDVAEARVEHTLWSRLRRAARVPGSAGARRATVAIGSDSVRLCVAVGTGGRRGGRASGS